MAAYADSNAVLFANALCPFKCQKRAEAKDTAIPFMQAHSATAKIGFSFQWEYAEVYHGKPKSLFHWYVEFSLWLVFQPKRIW